MKRFNLLSVVIAAVLMVAVSSCTTMREGYEDEYYTSERGNVAERIYVDDPYRGTIVLERDPYTGRYYQISPIGGRYNSLNDPYYRNNYNRNYYRHSRPVYQAPPRQQQPTPQPQDNQRSREETRRKVLGSGS